MRFSISRLDGRMWMLPIHLVLAALIVMGLTRVVSGNWSRAQHADLEKLPLSYGPRDFGAAMLLADDAVRLGEERVRRRPEDWIYQESLARALLGRARLTASSDDLARAGRALARGRAEAVAGSGPLLTDAVYNFTVHRLAPIAADLAAIEHFAVPADPGDRAEIAALRGDVAFYSGRYADAIGLYRQSQSIMDGPGVWFRIALWNKKTGNFDAARAGFERAALLNRARTPQFMANVELQIGIVELERGDWAAAEARFRKAERLFPGYWLGEAHAAQMLALRGDMAGARRRYLRIVARSGEPDVMDALAALYRSEGNAAESRRWASRAGAIWAQRLRDLPEAAYAHALEHELALGDPAQALALARRNMAVRPYGDSATMLGWALLANNRPAEARDVLEALNRTEWRTAQQYVALSQAYAMLGDGARSDAARDAALGLNPRAFDPAAPLIWFGHH